MDEGAGGRSTVSDADAARLGARLVTTVDGRKIGKVVLAGTPIGDRNDASPALAFALAHADVIAAEDTRRLRTLLLRLGVTTDAQVVSFFEGNEEQRVAGLVQACLDGRSVVVATDAGMPSVSDPGYRLVRAAVDAGIPVTAVPGPSAVLTALAVSGLPVDRFCFEGFAPRKDGERRTRLAELASERRTMVFFESPHRVAPFLTAAAEAFGERRPAAVCRELSKPHEDVVRGGLGELADWAASGEVLGEITVVIAGGEEGSQGHAEDALTQVRERVAGGQRLSEAVSEVAVLTGTQRKSLYRAALADEQIAHAKSAASATSATSGGTK